MMVLALSAPRCIIYNYCKQIRLHIEPAIHAPRMSKFHVWFIKTLKCLRPKEKVSV